MKTSKLFDIVNDILDADSRAQLQEIKSLKSALEKLKQKARALNKEVEIEKDEARCKELKDKIDIICAQRKKGLKLLKKLKKEKKNKHENKDKS
jgi:hypothetical protein